MLKPCNVPSILSIGVMVLGAGVASGQVYPSKPVRIVTSEAGGNGDSNSRLIAQEISGPLGQPVIVDNRPTKLIGEIVAKAPPDGYTLVLLGSILWFEPLMQKTPYDPVLDFAPISMVGVTPSVLVVHPSLPINSVKELIALAKARPGALNYAAGPAGSSGHLAGELFNSMAHVKIVGIPYKSAGPALTSLIGGEVQLSFSTLASVAPHVKSGRLKALAVCSTGPSALTPGLPTVAASGLPEFEAGNRIVMFVTAKTPEAIISRLNQEVVRALNKTDVKARMLSAGLEATPSSPETLAAMVISEMTRMGKVIKDAGIKTE